MAGRDRGEGQTAPGSKDPTAPKGRPTYGRKQRQAEARRRARRRQLKRRISWTVFILVLLGIIAALVYFDVGAVDPQQPAGAPLPVAWFGGNLLA